MRGRIAWGAAAAALAVVTVAAGVSALAARAGGGVPAAGAAPTTAGAGPTRVTTGAAAARPEPFGGPRQTAARRTGPDRPLTGTVIAIDPGHQRGNYRFPGKVNRLVDAGGFRKACNTTGTATDDGYPESAFTFSTARYLQERLERLGATVRLTRTRESADLWGPCIDARGRFGEKVGADVLISIHADGAPAGSRGFFVIRPANRRGWTDDVYARSRLLASDVRAGLRGRGLRYANYNGGDGLDERGDLGTLNWSDVPVVMVELGNMRNATDAALMRSASARDGRYAAGLADGIVRFLAR